MHNTDTCLLMIRTARSTSAVHSYKLTKTVSGPFKGTTAFPLIATTSGRLKYFSHIIYPFSLPKKQVSLK